MGAATATRAPSSKIGGPLSLPPTSSNTANPPQSVVHPSMTQEGVDPVPTSTSEPSTSPLFTKLLSNPSLAAISAAQDADAANAVTVEDLLSRDQQINTFIKEAQRGNRRSSGGAKPAPIARSGDGNSRAMLLRMQLEARKNKSSPGLGTRLPGRKIKISDLEGDPNTDPNLCIITGSGLHTCMARQLATFTIIARNKSGQRRREGGDVFLVSVRGASVVKPRLFDHRDGEYTVEYRPSVSGTYYVSISLGGAQLPNSPFAVEVLSSCADPEHCALRAANFTSIVARQPSSFEVEFADALGQATHAEELDVFVLPRPDDEPELKESTNPSDYDENADALMKEEQARMQAVASMEEATASEVTDTDAASTVPRQRETQLQPQAALGSVLKQAMDRNARGNQKPKRLSRFGAAVDAAIGNARGSTHQSLPGSGPANVPSNVNVPTAEAQSMDGTAGAQQSSTLEAGDSDLNPAVATEEEQSFDWPPPRTSSTLASKRPRQKHSKIPQTSATEVQEIRFFFRQACSTATTRAPRDQEMVAEYVQDGASLSKPPRSASSSPLGGPRRRISPTRPPRTLATWSGRTDFLDVWPSRKSAISSAAEMKGDDQAVRGLPVIATTAATDGSLAQNTGGVVGNRSAQSRLDGAERQRHMRLWAKMLADEQSRVKTEAHLVQLLGQRAAEGDEEAAAAITAAEAGPSFAGEIADDGSTSPRSHLAGFAYGGIYPGTLHAHGKVVQTHTVNFAIGRAGTYFLHVNLRSSGLPLPGSPLPLRVRPDRAHALSTRVPSKALPLRTIVGEQGTLTIHAADRVGNLCDEGGDPVNTMEPTRLVDCSTADQGDGTYQISWKGKASGTYKLHITICGTQIVDSPVEVTMLPANPDVSQCQVTGTGLHRAMAGRFAYFRVKSKDRFGNATLPDLAMKFGLCVIPSVAQVAPPTAAAAGETVEPSGSQGEGKDSTAKVVPTVAAPKPKFSDEEIYGITKAAAAAALAERAAAEAKLKAEAAKQTADAQANAAGAAAGELDAESSVAASNEPKARLGAALRRSMTVANLDAELKAGEKEKSEREKGGENLTSSFTTAPRKEANSKSGKKGSRSAEATKDAIAKAAKEAAEAKAAEEEVKAAAAKAAEERAPPPIVAKTATVPSMDFDGVWRPGGEFEIRYTGKDAGHFDLHIWCDLLGDGERHRLPGSPFRLCVSAAQPSPQGSLVAIDAKLVYAAGDKIELKPQLRDQFGNPCEVAERRAAPEMADQSTASYIMSELLSQHSSKAPHALLRAAQEVQSFSKSGAWVVSSPSRARMGSSQSLLKGRRAESPTTAQEVRMPELTASLVHPKGSTALALVQTDILGQYRVDDYTLTLKGEYEAHFALNGTPISGSPVKFQVVPTKPSGKHSYITAPDAPALVKLPYELMLHAVDRFGNRLTVGGAKVDVKVVGASAPCTVIDHKNGTYSLHFTVNGVGSYSVEVRIDGSKVRGSSSSAPFGEAHIDKSGLKHSKDTRAGRHSNAMPVKAAEISMPMPNLDGMDRPLELSASSPTLQDISDGVQPVLPGANAPRTGVRLATANGSDASASNAMTVKHTAKPLMKTPSGGRSSGRSK